MCLAIPGQVVDLADEHFAVVDVAGVRRKVNVDLVSNEAISPGDWVLIHVGFAMSKISAADAREQMRVLAALGEQELALEEIRGYRIEGAKAGNGP